MNRFITWILPALLMAGLLAAAACYHDGPAFCDPHCTDPPMHAVQHQHVTRDGGGQ